MNPRIEKIREYVVGLIDKAILKTDRFIERIEGMEKNLDEMEAGLKKGDGELVEKNRKELVVKATEEYKFANGMINEMGDLGKKAEDIEEYEERKEKMAKKVEGNVIKLGDLLVFLEFNKGDDEEIILGVIDKTLKFKGHSMKILDYNDGVISIEEVGNVRVEDLKKAMEHHITGKDGIEVEDALKMIKEIMSEEELQKFFKNKVLKHKKYQAKIYDFRDMKFHLIIRADNKFVHGWIPATAAALDRAVEVLSGYRNEHVLAKLEKAKPYGIKSLVQLEALPSEKIKKFLETLPKWPGFTKADVELIKDSLTLKLEEKEYSMAA